MRRMRQPARASPASPDPSKAVAPAHGQGASDPKRPEPRRAAPRRPSRRPRARRKGSSRSSASASSASASSLRSTLPASARNSPAARRMRLDFPLPFGPPRCTASPGPISRFMPSNSSLPPRRQVTPSNRSSAVTPRPPRARASPRRTGRNDARPHAPERARPDVRACRRRPPIRRGSDGETGECGPASYPNARRFVR